MQGVGAYAFAPISPFTTSVQTLSSKVSRDIAFNSMRSAVPNTTTVPLLSASASDDFPGGLAHVKADASPATNAEASSAPVEVERASVIFSGRSFDPRLTARLLLGFVFGVAGMWGFLAGATYVLDSLSKTIASDGVKQALTVLVFGAACFLNDLFVPFQREAQDKDFMMKLKRPKWAPPALAFPVVWIIIKSLWTAAAVNVFNAVGRAPLKRVPVGLFSLHLALASVWNNLYAKENQIGAGVPLIFVLWASFALTARVFTQVSQTAGLMYLPSVLWGGLASVLNVRVWQLNGREPLYPFKKSPSLTEPAPQGVGG
ncbi:unnamed protein product [Discosporangium mesarthrocarpum]